ncbi:membrane protein ORF81 [Cyprinid herpesvirus 1]|uniref:Membrane protein ORF81 n=1 Tax=Cyprinid herpesvirus 1 TaxID=317858 RepID=K7PBX3_9VIRU|nr:membrane protein ORF81 [Cyprinid herpesvirus 1]AFJ20378.1 membrane protein ORF81 [Cyprinid herpesvirus 1]
MAKIKAGKLKKVAKKTGSAFKSGVNKLVVKLPAESERFRILVATVSQTVAPMYALLAMGIAHAMWANNPDLDLNGTFIAIGLTGAFVFLVQVAILVMLCIRVHRGGHKTLMLMRPVIALFVINTVIFVVGVVYSGIVLLCKTVQYSHTAVCVANNAMSLGTLELFTACLIILKETLYGGFRMAEIKARLEGSQEYDEGYDSDDYDVDRYYNVTKRIQDEMGDRSALLADQDDDEWDDESVVGAASRGPRFGRW